MVAKNIRLPNIRKFFVPDPGFTIVDADLEGADAQVVAWEADDAEMKSAFKSGKKIHVVNCRAMMPDEHKDMTDGEIKERSPHYRYIKAGVHATNYGASVFALMHNLGWTKKFAEEFQEHWFFLHPAIREWHRRVQRQLNGEQCWSCAQMADRPGRCSGCGCSLGGTVKNPFGFRRVYFDRVDSVFKEALAWVPQSTVAFCSELGWINIAQGPSHAIQWLNGEVQEYNWSKWLRSPEAHDRFGPLVEFLIQVHDSIVFQVRYGDDDLAPEIVASMKVIVPYKDPLIIPLGFKSSRISWGDC